MTDFELAGSVGWEPPFASSVFGTWIAMLWTLTPFVASNRVGLGSK